MAAIRSALFRTNTKILKTLIDRFQYPERGPGQMWEMLTEFLRDQGYPVLLERPVVRICHDKKRVVGLALLGGLPAAAALAWVVWGQNYSFEVRWTLAGVVLAAWIGCPGKHAGLLPGAGSRSDRSHTVD